MNELLKGTADIVGLEDLKTKLAKKKPLIIKLGADPSAPDLHLGHFVVLKKLRQFQDLGHQVVFLIGDFTASIGDPTGKNEMRKPLTREEILENSQTYQEQVFKILDKSKTIIRYNSEWLNVLTPTDFIKLASQYTVARMLERDDFSIRYKSGVAIGIHEFMYPLTQGYDSVALKSDVELGGTDQRFNLIVGRDLQKSYGQEPQVCMMCPILEGLDGVKKMSKSLGNTINFNDSPKDIFGKIMSISDELMWRYFQVLFSTEDAQIESMKKEHPKTIKEQLALEVVSLFYPKKEADQARTEFNEVFAKGNLPQDIPEYKIHYIQLKDLQVLDLLHMSGLVESKGEARRLFQGAAISPAALIFDLLTR